MKAAQHTLCILICWAMTPCSFAQSVLVKVQFLDYESDRYVEGINIEMIPEASAITQNAGIAEFVLSASADEIEIIPPRGYKVMSPPNARLQIPRNETAVLKCWIKLVGIPDWTKIIQNLESEKEKLDQELTQMNELVGSLKRNNRQLADSVASRVRVIDSLQQRLLRIDSTIFNQKLQIVSSIDASYKQYLNAILNFSEQLRDVRPLFLNDQALVEFNRIVDKLNVQRDSLHENYMTYVSLIEKLWNPSLAIDLESVYDLALKEAYGAIIIPLNSSLISEITRARLGQKPRLAAMRKAKKPAKEAKNELDLRLGELQREADKTIKKLRSTI